MNDLIIYAAPAITLGVGLFLGYREGAKLDADQSQARADELSELVKSQSNLADTLAAKNDRLERIIAQETPGANATVKRMAAIARGEA